MQEFLGQLPQSRLTLVLRFVGVFVLAIFGFLALGTEVAEVLKTYFSIEIEPAQALTYVGTLYYCVIISFTFAGTFESSRTETCKTMVRILTGFTIVLDATLTAYFDLVRQRKKKASPDADE